MANYRVNSWSDWPQSARLKFYQRMSLGAGQYLEWQGAEEAKFQGKEDHFQIVTNVPPPPMQKHTSY